jgi:hypothetical protein
MWLPTDEITGYHKCGYLHNRSTTDQIFCIRQTLEKKWEYICAVYQLFIDFKKPMNQLGKYCTMFSNQFTREMGHMRG